MSWGLDEGLTIPHSKKLTCYEMSQRTSDLVGSFEHGDEASGCIKGGEVPAILLVTRSV
jgi:hypothetical protein